MAFDWGEAFFYSTDQTKVQGHLFNASLHGSRWLSGGDGGPEGNIFNVFLVVVAILLLSRVYPLAKYPVADSNLAKKTETNPSPLFQTRASTCFDGSDGLELLKTRCRLLRGYNRATDATHLRPKARTL